MISEELTFKKFGYKSTDWAPKSNKKIIDICNSCGDIREVRKADYRGSLCKSCVVKGRPKPKGWGERHSQIMRGRPNLKLRGKNSPNWKGGKSPLAMCIYNLLEYINWRREVFKRDNYTCQDCGAKSGNGKAVYLEAHHIKRFHVILQEFLLEYTQFSPIEDKETLIRLAISYKPFWDLLNGKTLCRDCHNKVTTKDFKERTSC